MMVGSLLKAILTVNMAGNLPLMTFLQIWNPGPHWLPKVHTRPLSILEGISTCIPSKNRAPIEIDLCKLVAAT
jgi:hypothetical protein